MCSILEWGCNTHQSSQLLHLDQRLTLGTCPLPVLCLAWKCAQNQVRARPTWDAYLMGKIWSPPRCPWGRVWWRKLGAINSLGWGLPGSWHPICYLFGVSRAWRTRLSATHCSFPSPCPNPSLIPSSETFQPSLGRITCSALCFHRACPVEF